MSLLQRFFSKSIITQCPHHTNILLGTATRTFDFTCHKRFWWPIQPFLQASCIAFMNLSVLREVWIPPYSREGGSSGHILSPGVPWWLGPMDFNMKAEGQEHILQEISLVQSQSKSWKLIWWLTLPSPSLMINVKVNVQVNSWPLHLLPQDHYISRNKGSKISKSLENKRGGEQGVILRNYCPQEEASSLNAQHECQPQHEDQFTRSELASFVTLIREFLNLGPRVRQGTLKSALNQSTSYMCCWCSICLANCSP